jgi:isopentenyl-diphosphate delta-isomerase
MVREAVPETPVIVSGGMRNGIDAAKAIALGGDLVGFAGPLLRAATESAERVVEEIAIIREQLRLAMFAVGARTLDELRTVDILGPSGLLIEPRVAQAHGTVTSTANPNGHEEGARHVSR